MLNEPTDGSGSVRHREQGDDMPSGAYAGLRCRSGLGVPEEAAASSHTLLRAWWGAFPG
jgi:hypothetical protein